MFHNNRKTGLSFLFTGRAAMGCAALTGVTAVQQLMYGAGIFSPPTLATIGLFGIFSAYGHMGVALGADLLHRPQGDHSSPDPVIAEFPILGRVLYALSERVIAKTATPGQAQLTQTSPTGQKIATLPRPVALKAAQPTPD